MVAQDGNAESVQYLIEGGANIDARNARGQSALHLAALAQSPETVEFLLKSGELRKGDRLSVVSQMRVCRIKWHHQTLFASK